MGNNGKNDGIALKTQWCDNKKKGFELCVFVN